MGPNCRSPRFELAAIVRAHRSALEASMRLTPGQRRVLTDLVQCRTATLGGHLDYCEGCKHERPAYNSCRNRHCPKCQALEQERWIEKERQRLLNVPHFHVVFTLPQELRPLAAYAPEVVFSLLFRCAADTLTSFAQRRLKATPGATLVLHTWDRELSFHPHIHAIVTGGGLRADNTWKATSEHFLFPVKLMARVFRAKMRDALKIAYHKGSFRSFRGFTNDAEFAQLIQLCTSKNWYVYSKRSFDQAKHVVEYLGRYTHRVALSNSRILDVSSQRVVMKTRGSGRVSLTGEELIRRFVRHVLPNRFHKIRHYGIYSGAQRERVAQSALPHVPSRRSAGSNWRARLLALTGRDVESCPRCGQRLVHHPLPPARASPVPP